MPPMSAEKKAGLLYMLRKQVAQATSLGEHGIAESLEKEINNLSQEL